MIVLGDADGVTVRRMLTYLYTLDYDDDGDMGLSTHYMLNGCSDISTTVPDPKTLPLPEEEATRHLKLMNNVVVYAMAEKYNIPELTELAKTKFSKVMSQSPLGPDLPPIVNAVFSTTPGADSGLRRTIIAMSVKYRKEILNVESLQGMLNDHGEIGLGMLQQLVPQMITEKEALRAALADVATLKQRVQTIFERTAELSVPQGNWERMDARTALNEFKALVDSYKTLQD